MKRLATLLSVILILFAEFGFAQTGTIKGRVVDSESLAMPGSMVTISSITKGTVSDLNGFFYLTGIPAGEYQVEVSYIGFISQQSTVKVEAGQVTELNFQMEPGVEEMEEIVVTGFLQGQSKALNLQMNNINITNIIASDQVGKFPDANIGDALKRIPGINVQYDQGEARFGNFRGIAPQYNSVTINGERIPSAEAEIRSIQLDLVPSDMIQTIEVNKAITADMDADAIGGSVNLVTKSAPYKRRISGTIGSGYNVLSGKPMLIGTLTYGDRFLDDKIGMVLSASYHNHQLGSDNIEAEWGGDNDNYYLKELQVRQYYLQRVRQSYSAAFDFKINTNHTIYLKGMYNHRNDWENRYRNIFEMLDEPDANGVYAGEVYDGPGDDGIEGTDDDEFEENKIERETKAGANDKNGRLEDQRMMQFSLNGDHLFGKVKVDWGFAYSKASEDRPQERYMNFVVEAQDVFSDISDPEFPMAWLDPSIQDFNSDWELDELTEENQYTEDVDVIGKINFELPLIEGPFSNSIKFGGKYKMKTKLRDNNFYEYSLMDSYEDAFYQDVLNNLEDFSKSDFYPGDYSVGSFVSRKFVGGLDLENTANFEKEEDLSEYAGNYDASENVIAGYFMLNQNFGSKISAILGVRYEQTSSENEGRAYDDDEGTLTVTDKVSSDYANILPNFHLRYNATNNLILRFAYTNSIARPNYFSLVPYVEIEDGEDISVGNSDLEPTTSSNIDFMIENYFKSIGIISGGFFYKDIKDFIVEERRSDVDVNGTVYSNYTRPINGGNAALFGVEFALQRQLDFLPGFLNGFGVYANYTYTNSEITDFNIEGREDETLSLPGSPENTFNASLSYESKKFSGRVSFNYASEFLDEVGEEAFEDRYYDQVTYLDLNLTYAINKNFTAFVDVNNLLNQPLRYYQGEQVRTMQAEYYGMRFQAGVKFDF